MIYKSPLYRTLTFNHVTPYVPLQLVTVTARPVVSKMMAPPSAQSVTATKAWASKVTFSRQLTPLARPAPQTVRNALMMVVAMASVPTV